MGRIAGHFEWDDNSLVPGRRKGGGLHSNLYDDEGKLKGNARFVPGHEAPVVTETVYVPVEQRRRTREEEELHEAIAALVSHLIDRGIAKATPHVKRLWRERVRPAIDSRSAKALRRAESHPANLESGKTSSPQRELADPAEGARPRMSSAEAQARYLAALAARAYSDEQLRLVSNASIVDVQGVAELERSLAALPADQLRKLIEAMATNPAMLEEATLAELASVLPRTSTGRRDDVPQLDRRQQ